MHNDVQHRQRSVIIKDLKDRVDAHIQENRQFTNMSSQRLSQSNSDTEKFVSDFKSDEHF
jgi:hypothetical protein